VLDDNLYYIEAYMIDNHAYIQHSRVKCGAQARGEELSYTTVTFMLPMFL